MTKIRGKLLTPDIFYCVANLCEGEQYITIMFGFLSLCMENCCNHFLGTDPYLQNTTPAIKSNIWRDNY